MMNKWIAIPVIVEAIRMPRFKPISARDSRNRLGRIKKKTPMGAILTWKVIMIVIIFSISLSLSEGMKWGLR